MDQGTLKVIAAVVSLHTSACLIDDYLQESGHNIYQEFKKTPDKNLKDILSARSKLYDTCLRMFPDYDSFLTDVMNEVSLKVEDLIIDEYLKRIERGEAKKG